MLPGVSAHERLPAAHSRLGLQAQKLLSLVILVLELLSWALLKLQARLRSGSDLWRGLQAQDWRVLGWMTPFEFTVFFAGLYALSYVVSEYVDRPVSSVVAQRIAEATARYAKW